MSPSRLAGDLRVEVCAAAMHEGERMRGWAGTTDWEDLTKGRRDHLRELARDALCALDAAQGREPVREPEIREAPTALQRLVLVGVEGACVRWPRISVDELHSFLLSAGQVWDKAAIRGHLNALTVKGWLTKNVGRPGLGVTYELRDG